MKTRLVRTLGAALTAAALFSTYVSAASATEFSSEAYPAVVTGEQSTQNMITFGSTSFGCETAAVAGEMTESGPALGVYPEFGSCVAFGFVNITIDSVGCEYVWNAGEELASNLFAGSMDIVCEEGETIALAAATCALEIGPQTGLTSISYENTESGITVDYGITGLSYTVTKDGFLCPLAGTGSFTNGTYSGEMEVVSSGEHLMVF